MKRWKLCRVNEVSTVLFHFCIDSRGKCARAGMCFGIFHFFRYLNLEYLELMKFNPVSGLVDVEEIFLMNVEKIISG